jgi:hypothetical protein
MIGITRLMSAADKCFKVRDTGGAFVECGVAKGGTLVMMKRVASNNHVWGFDSFQGLPPLTPEDEHSGQQHVGLNCCEGEGKEGVIKSFNLMNTNMSDVHVVEGYFEDSLPIYKSQIGEIAVLRLDADWYKGTRFCLDQLYDQVVDGGYIIIDDYGSWKGCKNAVDEFRKERNIESTLHQTDNTEFYWIKN